MEIYIVRAEIRHLEGIADPEGNTIERALPALGFERVGHIRVGKSIRFEVNADSEEDAISQGELLCKRLLANPVLESYELSIVSTIPAMDI